MRQSSSRRVLPGFSLSLGYALVYLSLLVLIPLGGLVARSTQLSLAQFWEIATASRALAAYKVSFGCALLAACVNAVFGLIVAWVLVRYEFFGKKLVDAFVAVVGGRDDIEAAAGVGGGIQLRDRQEGMH